MPSKIYYSIHKFATLRDDVAVCEDTFLLRIIYRMSFLPPIIFEKGLPKNTFKSTQIFQLLNFCQNFHNKKQSFFFNQNKH